MIGQNIVDAARLVLHDTVVGLQRWLDAELALWVTIGCRYIVIQRPDACCVNALMPLAAGAQQSIAGLTPPGLRLLDVLHNGVGGTVTYVDRHELDTIEPGWRSAAAGNTEHYVYDNRDPTNFAVYPPAAAGALLRVIYSRVPVAISAAELGTVTLSLNDLYFDPLLNYVLYRAYAKDAEATHNANLAQMYLGACNAGLGVKTTSDRAAQPDFNSPGSRVPAGTTIGGV